MRRDIFCNCSRINALMGIRGDAGALGSAGEAGGEVDSVVDSVR
jgi:hypothetical protein